MVAVLLDPDTAFEIELVETAARALGLQIVPVTLASERDLDAAFDRIVATGAGALLFGGGPVLRSYTSGLSLGYPGLPLPIGLRPTAADDVAMHGLARRSPRS